MKEFLLSILIGVQGLLGIGDNLGASVLRPYQGGTGISSATAGDVGKVLKVTNHSPFTYELASDNTGGGGGGDFPFTSQSWGNSTSTTLGFLNGFLSTASSTINSSLRLSSLGQGFLYTGSGGLVQPIASSSMRLSWFNNDVGFITDLSAFNTDNLAEGTVQYFTQERAQDAVGTILVDTATIDLDYNDLGGFIQANVLATSTLLSDLNTWSARQIFTNSSTTLASFSYASSTDLRAGTLRLGLSDGCLNITSGVVGSTGSACDGYGFVTNSYGGTTVQSTTTPLWLRATTPYSFLASSSLVSATSTTGALQAGSTAIGNNVIKVSPLTGLTTSNSESVGGNFNLNTGTTDTLGMVLYNNHTGTNRLLSLVCDAATYGGNCFHVRGDGTESVFNILGAPVGKGVGKITHQSTGDADASILSLDASAAGYLGQGIFVDCTGGSCAGTNSAFQISDEAGNNGNFKVLWNGKTGIASSTPTGARLSVNSVAGDLFSFWVGSTTAPWLQVSNSGFGTTTLSGLNIAGSATSTSNVGFNISAGCYAIGGTCIGGGGGSGDITSVGDVTSGAAFDGTQGTTLTFNNAGGDATLDYDGDFFNFTGSAGMAMNGLSLTNTELSTNQNLFNFKSTTATGIPFIALSANLAEIGLEDNYQVAGISVTNTGTGVSTSTANYALTVASSTKPQLSLSAGAGIAQWTMRNAGGNLYFATTTVAGTATSTVPSLTINGSTNTVTIPNLTLTTPLANTSGGTGQTSLTSGFSYASSTWTGTTTQMLGPAPFARTFVSIRCETNTGTANVSIYDGTNRMNMLNASTTVGEFTFSTNNSFTAGESMRVDIGTPASSVARIGCTYKYTQ